MSKITIVGNATSDVELRYTQGGVPVANVNVAENVKVGEKEHTNFHRVTIWRDMAEHAAGSIHKGMRVIVVGKLDQREFEDREGNKRQAWDVTADAIGPDLRWATAQVTRIQGQQGQSGANQGETASSGTWTTPSPQGGAQQAAQDAWSQPVTEDTPF